MGLGMIQIETQEQVGMQLGQVKVRSLERIHTHHTKQVVFMTTITTMAVVVEGMGLLDITTQQLVPVAMKPDQ